MQLDVGKRDHDIILIVELVDNSTPLSTTILL